MTEILQQQLASQVQKFYNNINFPGKYTVDDLLDYGDPIENKFLAFIEKHIQNCDLVLDAGCGTGLTTNLFAVRNDDCNFVGVDFSLSITYAKDFAKKHSIHNVDFKKQDLVKYKSLKKFDAIICQGVLHHIPDINMAIDNMKSLLNDDGKIILGLYHPMGKLLKKIVKINYKSDILYKDQEQHPYETAWTKNDVAQRFPDFTVVDQYPKSFIGLRSFLDSTNGGLCMYVLKK
jgi:2-polyprenyl-3-methyl-5-hydroxy-6-metoxy-1,4-benzoquinol methylase